MVEYLTISQILTYNGSMDQIVLNYLAMFLSFIYLFTNCNLVPVNANTKIIERLIWIPLYGFFIGLQIAFYIPTGCIGVSMIWSGILGFVFRQLLFYWDWLKFKRWLLIICNKNL